MRTKPKIVHGYQTLAFQPLIGHPGLSCQRLGKMPVTLAADRRHDRLMLRYSPMEFYFERRNDGPLQTLLSVIITF